MRAGAESRLRSPLFPTLEQKILSKPPHLMPRGRDKDLMNRYRKYRSEIKMSPFYMSTEEQVNVRYSDQHKFPTDRPLPTWLPQFKPERFLPKRLCRWLNVSHLWLEALPLNISAYVTLTALHCIRPYIKGFATVRISVDGYMCILFILLCVIFAIYIWNPS